MVDGGVRLVSAEISEDHTYKSTFVVQCWPPGAGLHTFPDLKCGYARASAFILCRYLEHQTWRNTAA